MTHLSSRLVRIERKAAGRPCPAAGQLPRCVLIDGQVEHERFVGQVKQLEQRCTCGRCGRVKLVVLDVPPSKGEDAISRHHGRRGEPAERLKQTGHPHSKITQMEESTRHPWALPIVFEGVTLPPTAFAIDHLARLPGLSDEASEWLWRFTICRGRTNSDESSRIVRVVAETLDAAEASRSYLLTTLPAYFDGPFDEAVLADWLHALRTILNVARARPRCSWTSLEGL